MTVLRGLPATPEGPGGVVGFSMGASLGLWVATRELDAVGCVYVTVA